MDLVAPPSRMAFPHVIAAWLLRAPWTCPEKASAYAKQMAGACSSASGSVVGAIRSHANSERAPPFVCGGHRLLHGVLSRPMMGRPSYHSSLHWRGGRCSVLQGPHHLLPRSRCPPSRSWAVVHDLASAAECRSIVRCHVLEAGG